MSGPWLLFAAAFALQGALLAAARRRGRELGRTLCAAALLAGTLALALLCHRGSLSVASALPLLAAQVLAALGLALTGQRPSRPASGMEALRRRLERAERLALVGELAARVAHELKNPLAPVRGYAELLEQRLEGLPAEQRAAFGKGLAIIKQESSRIEARLGELLVLTRAERGGPPGARFELGPVLAEVLAVAEQEPGIRALAAGPFGALGVVHGDADELRGALLNLLKNAGEAMAPRGGNVEVRAAREGERVVVEVLDEGPGFSPELAERLFEPFFTTKADGTGLGLSIARSAIEGAGGRLELTPRTDRPGCSARVELRAAE
jgi:signal transduction histidine kinase